MHPNRPRGTAAEVRGSVHRINKTTLLSLPQKALLVKHPPQHSGLSPARSPGAPTPWLLAAPPASRSICSSLTSTLCLPSAALCLQHSAALCSSLSSVCCSLSSVSLPRGGAGLPQAGCDPLPLPSRGMTDPPAHIPCYRDQLTPATSSIRDSKDPGPPSGPSLLLQEFESQVPPRTSVHRDPSPVPFLHIPPCPLPHFPTPLSYSNSHSH